MKLYRAKTDGDEGVRGIPVCGTGSVFGYEKIETYFVDSSGFGSVGERALTFPAFLERVKAGRYYGIAEAGQFQVRIVEFIKSHEKKESLLDNDGLVSRKRLAVSTYELKYKSGKRAIRYYETDVLTFEPEGFIRLNSGGWHTATTQKRINKYLPDGWRVFSEKGRWGVKTGNEVLGFVDNMKIQYNMEGKKI